jgi:hypothetical protein
MDSSGHGAGVQDPHATSADAFKQPCLDLDQWLAAFVCDRFTRALGVAVPGLFGRANEVIE